MVLLAFWISSKPVLAGDFSFNWGGTHNWTANSLGPATFTLTDPFGFQVDVRLGITQFGGTPLSGYPDDLFSSGGNTFGSETSIWLVWDANNNSSGVGESTNTATMEILSGGSPFSAGILSFRVSDIDTVDNDSASDRCDFITATGNVGNPTLTYVSPTPASRSGLIGPAAGSGLTGPIAANQAQCIYNVGSPGSNSSNGDDNGSILVTYPTGTHTATIQYDESIENVYNSNRNAAARGVGVWGATIFSVNQTISLAKSTTTTSYSALGQAITYNYIITNNGPLPIRTGQNIQIQDDKIGSFACGTIAAPIASGGTHSCSANYIVAAGDMTAPNITNNAIAGVGTGAQSFATRLQSNTVQVIVPRRPTVTLTKVSNGGVGPFTFTGTNGWANQTITTTTSGVGVSGSTQTLTAVSTATTITEAIPAGYQLTSISCTGLGSGGTATPNLATGAVTLDVAATAPGSNIACTFTNARRPTVTLTKVSNGGVGPFTFTGTNGWANQTITTTTSGVGVSGSTQTLTAVSTATTITEAIPAGYQLTSISCTGLGSGGTATPNLATGAVTLDAAATAPGSNIACTFTNARIADYSDAPLTSTSYGPSSHAILTGIYLGAGITSDPTDYDSPNASGDVDDGVTIPAMVQGMPATIDVSVSGAGGYLQAWIDWDGASDFTIGEQVAVNVQDGGPGDGDGTVNGTILLNVVAPAAAVTSQTFARFRWSTVSGLGYSGFANDGEVEDYALTVTAASSTMEVRKYGSVSVLSGSDNTISDAGDTVSFAITIQNTGNVTLTSVGFNSETLTTISGGPLTLSSGPTFLSSTLGSPEGTLLPSEIATYGASYILEQAAVDAGGVINTTTGTGTPPSSTPITDISDDPADTTDTDPEGDGEPDDPTVVLIPGFPSLIVTKIADDDTDVSVGQVITYTYTVTNNGNQSISDISLSDNVTAGSGATPTPNADTATLTDNLPTGGSANPSTGDGVWDTLAPGDVLTITSTYTVTQTDVDTLQ